MVSRRGFLQMLGAAVTLSAGGIALLEAEPIRKAYFLPPRCGWNAGTWELACAQEALAALNRRLGVRNTLTDGVVDIQVNPSWLMRDLDDLLARRQRLVKRCDKLARGWTPTRIVYHDDGRGPVVVHGSSRWR